MPRAFTAAGLTTVFLAVAAVHGQTKDLTVDEAFAMPLEELMTVNIATGTPRSLAEAPAIATVITADDIEATGAGGLDEVLESVPGLHVSYSHISYEPLYTMRGLFSESGSYVLFQINGVPINSYLDGGLGVHWGGMPVRHVSRIEIVRGPGSALSGADAVGGVVNIVTKSAEEIGGTEVGVRAGSFDTQEAWLLHGSRRRGFDIALALQARTTEGQSEIVEADAQTGFDHLFGTDASLAPGPVSAGRDSVEVNLDVARRGWRLRMGFQGRYDLGTGAGQIQTLDPVGGTERQRYSTDLSWSKEDLAPQWHLDARVSYLTDKDSSETIALPPGSFNGVALLPQGAVIEFGLTEQHWRFEATATYRGLARHRVRLGTGYHRLEIGDIVDKRNLDPIGRPLPGGFQDVSDDPHQVLGFDQSRALSFVLAQDEWRLTRDLDLTLGLRWDRFADFGDTVNPRLALVWKISDRLTSKFLYGRAFRPPIYREQHLINNPELLGNPELEPEVSATLELGFAYQPAAGRRLGVNFFTHRLEDLIVPRGSRPLRPQNVGEVTGRGFELEAEWQLGHGFGLLANYAYQRTLDEDSDTDLGHAPGQQLYLRADWRFRDSWRFNVVANAVADRERQVNDGRDDVDDYVTVDMALRRARLIGNLELALVVRNLFDEDVHEPSIFVAGPIAAFVQDDLPLAGRNAYVELRYRFK